MYVCIFIVNVMRICIPIMYYDPITIKNSVLYIVKRMEFNNITELKTTYYNKCQIL